MILASDRNTPQKGVDHLQPGVATAVKIYAGALVALSATGYANRARGVIDEADPRTSSELLADWERVTGLPDACSAGIATTLQERRAAVVARLTATGGQSVGYFAGMIAALGYQAVVDEFRPFICGTSSCGDALNGAPSVRHVWRVRITEPRVTWFRAGASQAGDKLGKITRAEDLECLLARRKPAHTTVIVAYEGA